MQILCSVYSRVHTKRASTNTFVSQGSVSISLHLRPSLSADRTSFVRSPQDPEAHLWVGSELDTARVQKSMRVRQAHERERKGDKAPSPRRTGLDMLGAPRLGPNPRWAPPWERRGCQSPRLL